MSIVDERNAQGKSINPNAIKVEEIAEEVALILEVDNTAHLAVAELEAQLTVYAWIGLGFMFVTGIGFAALATGLV